MEMDICAGRPCILVARFFYRHAHSSRLHSNPKAPSSVVLFRHVTCQPHNALLCLASSIEEDTRQNDAGTRLIKAKFVLRRRCEFGQRFYVIGDDKLLGGWAPELAIPMEWSEGHVWTLQMDLLSGTCAEFKVLLKADEDVLEWQPGANRKLEVPVSVTSHLVFVSWFDGEESSENEALQFLEMKDLQKTQYLTEVPSSTRSPSVVDSVRAVDLGPEASVSRDVTGKPKTEQRSAGKQKIKSNAKDFVAERQAGAKRLIAGDQGLVDEATYPNSELRAENFLSLYPIPDSWYAQESSDALVSRDFTEPSPLETGVPGKTVILANEFSVSKQDEAREKPLISDRTSEEHISKEKVVKQLTGEDEPADMMAPSNVGAVLSDAESEDIQKAGAEFSVTQHELTGVTDEPKEKSIVDPAVLHNDKPTDDEQPVDNKDPIEVSAETSLKSTDATSAKHEMPGSEVPSMQSDLIETVETKSVKDKKWGRKRWSKLWGALVQGRLE